MNENSSTEARALESLRGRARDFVRSRFGKPQKMEAEFLHETAANVAADFATQEVQRERIAAEEKLREFIGKVVEHDYYPVHPHIAIDETFREMFPDS